MKGRTTLALAVIVIAALAGPAQSASPEKNAAAARHEAKTGGILGRGWGQATPRMKLLARKVIVDRFAPAGQYAVNKALCYATRESGLNPGAVSRTGDHGLGQINYYAHHRTYDFARIYDPVYNAGVMWAMSAGGTRWGPWAGGTHSC